MPKVNTKREIILQASGAGILITLYGIKKKTAKWKFILEKDEDTMADFLLEEDEDLLPLLEIAPENPVLWTGMKGVSAKGRKNLNQMLKRA